MKESFDIYLEKISFRSTCIARLRVVLCTLTSFPYIPRMKNVTSIMVKFGLFIFNAFSLQINESRFYIVLVYVICFRYMYYILKQLEISMILWNCVHLEIIPVSGFVYSLACAHIYRQYYIPFFPRKEFQNSFTDAIKSSKVHTNYHVKIFCVVCMLN